MSDDSNETTDDASADTHAATGADDASAAEQDAHEAKPTPADRAAAKAKADAAVAERKVTRRTVTSRRVTPRGGATPDAPVAASKARDAKKTESVVSRTPPAPQGTYAKGPSPWWVPALMFFLLIAGALVIMTNYMGVFGDASNVRLVLGLGLILGGIVTATQYR